MRERTNHRMRFAARRAAPRAWTTAAALLGLILASTSASAFRLIGAGGEWVRWDAAPRVIGGLERSLEGGLRYSIETGSYAALRDQFMWTPAPPSEEDFAEAIARAFEHWTVVDPESGLPGAFHFVEDLATVAVDAPGVPGLPASFLGANPGAEIDIFAETPHPGSNFAASVIFFVDAQGDDLTLTSGTENYAGFAMGGADIRINPGLVWSLRGFETLLAHEIGHALGIADLEAPTVPGSTSPFFDDNYDPTSAATAVATLTNSFALTIDPFDPDQTPLQSFFGNLDTDPGVDTPGVNLLMESDDFLLLLDATPKLQNDDFAARQFLYPVPEAGQTSMLRVGLMALLALALLRQVSAFRRSSEAGANRATQGIRAR